MSKEVSHAKSLTTTGRTPCVQCEGSGFGPCSNCGDLFEVECACDDPQESDCDVCGGTGFVQEDE